MKPDIIVFSKRTKLQIAPMICDLEGFAQGHRIIWTGDRNNGLDQAKTDIIVMLDDNISGFYDDWIDELIEPLLEDEDVVFVTANLLMADGSAVPMMFRGNRGEKWSRVPRGPTGCIAIRNDGMRFDDESTGDGSEADIFCAKFIKNYENPIFLIHNDVKIVQCP